MTLLNEHDESLKGIYVLVEFLQSSMTKLESLLWRDLVHYRNTQVDG